MRRETSPPQPPYPPQPSTSITSSSVGKTNRLKICSSPNQDYVWKQIQEIEAASRSLPNLPQPLPYLPSMTDRNDPLILPLTGGGHILVNPGMVIGGQLFCGTSSGQDRPIITRLLRENIPGLDTLLPQQAEQSTKATNTIEPATPINIKPERNSHTMESLDSRYSIASENMPSLNMTFMRESGQSIGTTNTIKPATPINIKKEPISPTRQNPGSRPSMPTNINVPRLDTLVLEQPDHLINPTNTIDPDILLNMKKEPISPTKQNPGSCYSMPTNRNICHLHTLLEEQPDQLINPTNTIEPATPVNIETEAESSYSIGTRKSSLQHPYTDQPVLTDPQEDTIRSPLPQPKSSKSGGSNSRRKKRNSSIFDQPDHSKVSRFEPSDM